MSVELLCCGDATHLDYLEQHSLFPVAGRATNRQLFSAGLACIQSNCAGSVGCESAAVAANWTRGLPIQPWFLRSLWRQASQMPALEGQPRRLLSHYPLLPPFPWPADWRVSFYIDATTRQVFEDYGAGSRISKTFQRVVLQRERAAYQAAEAVITMSDWAAESVCRDYGIESARVHVVPGGANLEERVIVALPVTQPPPAPSPQTPLRLGFLGKDWERKGGPFVLA